MTVEEIVAEYPTVGAAGVRAAAPTGRYWPPDESQTGRKPKLSAANVLAERAHDIETVAAEGLTGANDADVVAAATQAARLLLTLDRGLGDVRRYPPGSHAGIVVLRPANQSAAAVRELVADLAAGPQLEALTGLVAVAHPARDSHHAAVVGRVVFGDTE